MNVFFKLLVIVSVIATNLPHLYGKDIFGKVTDYNGNPIELANVAIMTQDDSTFVRGETTDSIGAFNFKQIEESKEPFLIKVHALGYKDTCVYFHNNPCEIMLKESSLSLDEVVVNGGNRIFRQTPTGIKTIIAGTPLSSLSSMGEVLDYIPGLFKDAQGGYKIAGKGTPVFYINGRRVYDYADIENLTPNYIKDVEIVRNPGVSYDANINAVVKITTKKALDDGFSMNLRSSYYYWTNSDFVEQFNWNFRKGGLDIFGNHSFTSQNTTIRSSLTQVLYADTIWQQKNNQKVLNHYRIFKNTVGFNYGIDKQNSIGIKYNIEFPLNTIDTGTLDSYIFVDGKYYDQLTSNNRSKNEAPAQHHINTYYRGEYGKLSVGADCDFLNYKQTHINYYNEKSKDYQDREVQTNGIVSNTLFASKAFAELTLAKGSLTIGFDYSYTHRKNDYNSNENIINSQNDDIHEKHLSPYADIKWNIGNCQIIGGIRYEKVLSKYLLNGYYSNKNYGDLYPNISIFLPLQNVYILVGYSLKDKKPSYAMLRNEISYGNRYTYQTGNPYLKPEKIHNINFSMVYKWLQFVVDYTDRRNAILYTSDFYNNNSSIALISFCNIPTLKSMTGSLSISQSIGLWKPTVTLATTKQWFSIGTTYGKIQLNNPILMANFSNIFNFGKGWRTNVSLNYTSKGDNENCKISRPSLCVDLRIYKYFMNNNLSLNFGVTDLFDSQKSGNILYLNNLNTTQIEWRDNREISITLTYRFNSVKGRYKGDNAGREEQERL